MHIEYPYNDFKLLNIIQQYGYELTFEHQYEIYVRIVECSYPIPCDYGTEETNFNVLDYEGNCVIQCEITGCYERLDKNTLLIPIIVDEYQGIITKNIEIIPV